MVVLNDEDIFDSFKKTRIINFLNDKSIVHDRPDDDKWNILCNKEINRLKNKDKYHGIPEYCYGSGAKKRRK